MPKLPPNLSKSKFIAHLSDDDFCTTKLLMPFTNPQPTPESSSVSSDSEQTIMKSSLNTIKKFWQLSKAKPKQPDSKLSKQQNLAMEVPDLASMHRELAANLKEQGKLEEAIAHYRQAIQLHPGSDSSDLVLSGELVEDEQEPKKEAQLAVSAQTGKIVTNQAIQVYLQQAQGYYKNKEWKQTIEACQRALEIDERIGDAYRLWGNALQAQGKTLEAMSYYGKALEVAPDSAPVYVNLGSLSAKQQQWSQAMDYYCQAIELEPNLAAAHRNLAKVFAKMGKVEDAAKSRYQAFSLEPEQAKAQEHFELGEQLWELGLVTESIACYRRAIRTEPNWIVAYQKLADALIRQGQVKEGAEYAQKAQQLRQQGGETQSSVALALHGQKSGGVNKSGSLTVPSNQAQQVLQQAQSILNEAQQTLQPAENALKGAQRAIVQAQGIINQVQGQVSDIVPTNSQATVKQLNGDQGQANPALLPGKSSKIDQYLHQATLQPDSADIQANLGTLYAQKQDWNMAIAYYKKALALDGNLVQVHRNLAKVFTQLGKETEATNSWYQALRLEPQAVDAQQHLKIGNSLAKQGKVQEALVCWQQAIRLQPNLSEAYDCWGKALVNQGDVNRAVAVYRRALETNNSDGVSWYRLAEIYRSQENWSEAMKCYQRVTQLRPNFAQAYHQLGEVLLQLNQLQNAEKYFRRAIELSNK